MALVSVRPLDRAGNRDEFSDEHRWPGRWCIPGTVTGGVVTTTVGEFTGTAPCWNCEPQPGWGYQTVTPETKVQNKSDYGTDSAKPNLQKGWTNQDSTAISMAGC